MKKLRSLFLVLLFLTSMTYPAFAADHRETVLNYLMEKYDVPEEKIELREGGITKLEFTDESFWYADYTIFPEGKPASGTHERQKPLPGAEPMPLPAPDAPDTSSTSRPAIMPIPPQDVVSEGNIYGVVHIRIKTSEIVEQDDMETFFFAERQLAKQEWERLRKEAGKLDVALYRKLQGVSAAEKVPVSIQPTPVETDDLKAQFEALKKKYPKHTSGMELKGIFPNYGYDTPVSSGQAVSAGDAAVSYIIPDNVEKADPPSVEPDIAILPAAPDEEYSAVWEELEQIRIQAVRSSLSAIKETLDGMNVTYEDKRESISADLTAEQINNIAKLPEVSTIFEDVIFTTMEVSEDQLAHSGAPNVMMAASAQDAKDESPSSYMLLIFISVTTALLAGAFVIYRSRVTRNN